MNAHSYASRWQMAPERASCFFRIARFQESAAPATSLSIGKSYKKQPEHPRKILPRMLFHKKKRRSLSEFLIYKSIGLRYNSYAVGKAPAGSLCCTLRVPFSAKCQSHDIPARSRQVRCAILYLYFSSFLAIYSEKEHAKIAKVALWVDFFSEIYRNHERNVV